MIPELGHYALILALALALVQVIVPGYGLYSQHPAYLRLAGFTAVGQFFFVSLSFATLAYALLANDFSVVYVATNSNSHLPALYRFCALWGAHEGSMLLWVFILSGWGLALTLLARELPSALRARILMVLALVAIGFYLFLLLTSDPFARFLPDFPIQGRDLNPILQDPGLAIHPPMLYMGYVGFAVTFAFAIAALWGGDVNQQWATWTRPWAIAAWCFLTLGIVLGSAWAYRELGWGGWWFWDPVENASFLPWLVGTALIHSLIVTEKRGLFRAWTVLLAIFAFCLSLLGTFLVRSGVLISVHTFATDPQRGLYMLLFLLLVIGGSLTVFAWRGRDLTSNGSFTLASRETLLLSNNILLFVAMLTVLLGTLYPLVIDVLHLGKLSVGPPYFNAVFLPLMAPVIILMAVAPQLQWRQTQKSFLWLRFSLILVLSVAAAFILPSLAGAHLQLVVVFGLVLVFWLVGNMLSYSAPNWRQWLQLSVWRKRNWAMLMAHTGMAVTALGIILSTAYSQERDVRMQLGDTVRVGPYQFEFARTRALQGPNYEGVQATINIYQHQQLIRVLYPQQRIFRADQTDTSKAAIDASLFRDLYVALGSPLPNKAWSLRIYYKPFIRWIWAGGIMMMLGGIMAWFKRRLLTNKIYQGAVICDG